MSKSLPFKILRLHHVALASDAEKTRHFLGNVLQLSCVGTEEVKEQKTHTTFYEIVEDSPKLEVIRPTADDSVVAKYIAKKGYGIHHLALEVDDIDVALKYLIEQDVAVVQDEPSVGAHGTRVFFIHPKATGGILVEFVQV